MVYTLGLGPSALKKRAGSTPVPGTSPLGGTESATIMYGVFARPYS